MAESLESLTTDDELEDGTEGAPFSVANIDTALVTSPAVLRSVGSLVVATAMLAWPDRTDRVVARLIAVGLIWLAVSALRAWAGSDRRSSLGVVTSVATMVAGVALFLTPDRSSVFLGRSGPPGGICTRGRAG